jgi:polar amino acid transport system substrate-binding protein
MTAARLLASAALALAAAPALSQEVPDLGGREIVIATENAYPPIQFLSPEGTPVGWEYDFMTEAAERLNFVPVYETISWDAMIAAVSEGQFDMGMTGITIREDRAEVVDFSAPYMTSQMLMLVRADEERFTDAASFAADPDLLVSAQPGPRPSTPRSTRSSTATRPTRAS